jgi:hypothetical protein
MTRTLAMTTLLIASALAGGAAGAAPEDDLAVVKKAVASASPAPVAAAPRAAAAREPKWFKVRLLDKGAGHRKVTVNLPLSVVRALGDETLDLGCRSGAERDRCHTVHLADVLKTLEAGQDLVEVEDEQATIKVWVE